MDSLRGMEVLFGVSGKGAKQSRRSESCVAVDEESLAWKKMTTRRRRMLPQDDQSRPFAPGVAHGPTSNSNSRPKPSICIPSPAAGGAGDGEFWLQPFQFDISSSNTNTISFKSPEVMYLEFPFTRAQWKELERQALIYKYMVASLPVPPHLLTLITKSPHDPAAASQPTPGNGLNLRLSGKGGDAEPGRCRRTDGKKWRCSRDVAPDQKYCERHMHRGRPRSRKHVELPATKKIRPSNPPSTDLPSSASPSAIDFTNYTAPAPGSHFFLSNLAQSSYQNHPSEKASIFGCTVPSISSHKEPRGLEWVMNGEPVPLHDHNEPLKLNSLATSFGSGEDQQTNNNTWPLFFNPDKAAYSDRGFIDAWSGADDTNPGLCARNSVSSSGGLCPSPLSLTVGGKDAIDDHEIGVSSQHGIIDDKSSDLATWLAPSSWSASSAGGPLAEVLRPRKPAAVLSDPASPVAAGEGISCSSAVTAGSSPSGVLQKGLLSFSDSSGNTESPTAGSSGANSDIGLVWLSTGKLASSS